MANRINLNQTGAIEEIANEAKAHGFKKAFVCSDPDLVKFHVTSKVTDILEKRTCERQRTHLPELQNSDKTGVPLGMYGSHQKCRI